MNASNWLGNREMSPDRNNRYRVDNIALQLGLGFPIELVGISRPSGDSDRPFNYSETGWVDPMPQPCLFSNDVSKVEDKSKSVADIIQTVDGIPIRCVYVTNIGLEVQWREISTIFCRFGKIMNIFLKMNRSDNKKQFAFVTFEDPKAACRVITLKKFQDRRGHYIYAMAADSWHQPKEDSNGKIIWRAKCKMNAEEEQDDEEDDRSSVKEERLRTVQVNEEGMNILNDDCLLHIFSFFSLPEVAGVERVCKRWQGLSYQIWRRLQKLSFSEPTWPLMKAKTSTLTAYLHRCGSSLRELDLAVNNHEFDETTLAVVAKYCNNLEVLRVSQLDAGNRSLAHLGRSCPKLKQLFLKGCGMFTDKDLTSMLSRFHSLNVLDISYNAEVSGRFLTQVQIPLVRLQLSELPLFESNALISGLQKLSESLKVLVLNSCGNLNGGEVKRLVSAVPNLTSLSLCRIHAGLHFNSNMLVPLSELKKLNSINLSLNSAVNDNMLAAIVYGCEDLTDINLSGCGGCTYMLTDEGLSILSRLRHLTHLDISYLENTTDLALKGITARNSKLQKLICRGCPEITDEGPVQVVTVCNDLKLFDISGCSRVTEQTVCAALTSVKMRTNNVPLKLIVGGTDIREAVFDPEVPLLTVDLQDLSEEHLRPDFMDEMFFPPSDSDEEEVLDHLCEQFALLFDDFFCDTNSESGADGDISDYSSDFDPT